MQRRSFYIGVPDSFIENLSWDGFYPHHSGYRLATEIGARNAEIVRQNLFRNGKPRIYHGCIYRVTFKKSEDLLLTLLKHGFTLINDEDLKKNN